MPNKPILKICLRKMTFSFDIYLAHGSRGESQTAGQIKRRQASTHSLSSSVIQSTKQLSSQLMVFFVFASPC